MPVPDLTEFLHARIAEDEATARAAFSGQADPENGWGAERSVAGGWTIVPHVGVIHEEVQALHVARWDPARVLAEVAAKRAMLKLHEHIPSWDAAQAAGDDGDPGFGCRTCHSQDGEVQSCGWCPTILALAQVDAEHPDFDPAWRLRPASAGGTADVR